MSRISLQNLIGRKKDASSAIANLLDAIGAPASIEDAEGRLLLGDLIENPEAKYPIKLEGKTLGWVSGSQQVEAVAELLTLLAGKEAEKKTMGNEVLHLYREVNLIYNFSEKLAALLELETVASMALDQARQLITATGGAVMLLDEATQSLESVADFGEAWQAPSGFKLGEGILGAVTLRGNAEIINAVRLDPRYVEDGNAINCWPCTKSWRWRATSKNPSCRASFRLFPSAKIWSSRRP